MIIGYSRSLFLTVLAFIFGGLIGVLCFLLCALIAKVLLESINYIEHYGLVREKGEPVGMRHSWNSNHFLSSIYLCNVTRHSDHHRSASLNFWELNPTHKDAPLLPYGYLSMLYLVLITPFLYKKIMAKELVDWDQNRATEYERNYTMQ
jgi:alkane 1-monooxygenase